MRIRSRAFIAGILPCALSACISTATTDPNAGGRKSASPEDVQAVAAPENGAPRLPEDYKKLAAIRLVAGYVDDASGPPQISEPEMSKGPLGATTRAIIRYPVSSAVAARTNFMARMSEGTYYRCASINAHTSITTFGATEVSVMTSKSDTTECNPSLRYNRYKELEDLAAQCRDPQGTCEIVRTPLGGTMVRVR